MSALRAWAANRRQVGLTLLALVLVVYLSGILGAAFHFDDVHHVTGNPALRDPSNLWSLRYFKDPTLWSGERGNVMYRPVGMLPHAIDHLLWSTVTGTGFYAPGWVLTNALLHAGVAILVWRLALRLGLSELAAALAGLVMALHPVNSEVVNYVSSRSESVAALLLLLGLLAHLRARGSRRPGFAAWTLVAAACSVLSLLAKETSALFFLAAAWLDVVTLRGPWGRRLARAALSAAVYGAALCAVLVLRRVMIDHFVAPLHLAGEIANADPQVGAGRTVVQNLLTQARVVVLYYELLLRPLGLTVDHDVAVITRLTPAVAVACVLHLGLAAVALRALARGHRLLPLCAGWFWLFLAPSVVIPLNVIMNEHRLYLPGIAVSLLAGAALARVGAVLARRHGEARAGWALALPFVLFAAGIVHRSREWHDDRTLWEVAVQRAPHSARAHMHLGATWHEAVNATRPGQGLDLVDKALACYAEADRLHPRWYDLQLNIGGAWLARGRITGRQEDFERALAAYVEAGRIVGPERERPRYLQAAALTELGRCDEAIAILRAMDEADDSVTTVYDDALARAYRKKGDRVAAAEALERVIAIEEPRDKVDGLLTLGWWMFEDGELKRSEGYLTRALEIAKRTRQFRPYLYIARFLNLVHEPGADTFAESARKLGWSGAPDEAAWVAGGRTPGAR